MPAKRSAADRASRDIHSAHEPQANQTRSAACRFLHRAPRDLRPGIGPDDRGMNCAPSQVTLDGVLLFSNVQGIYVGDPRFEPVFTELDRRGTTVFVHPNPSPDPVAHRLGLPDSLIDFTADTTRAVAEMLYTTPVICSRIGPRTLGGFKVDRARILSRSGRTWDSCEAQHARGLRTVAGSGRRRDWRGPSR